MPEEEWSDDAINNSDSNNGKVVPYSRFQEKASEWGNKMQEKASRREGSKGLAKLAEDGASKTGSATSAKENNSSFMSAVQNARDAEGKVGFANNVQGKTLEQVAATAVPGGKMLVNQAKKFGPLGTILLIIAALIGVFAGTQSLAPFGLIANGLDQFNNLRTSMNRRTTYFNRFMLNRNHNVSVTRATIFGSEKFNISKSMSKKLAKNKIYFVDKSEYGARFLVYEDEKTGKKYAVAANDNDVGKLPDSAEVEIDGKKTTIEINSKMKIDDALVDSVDFSNSMDRGTRTLKGHIAGWFDELSNNLHMRFKSSRNKFRDVSDTADDDEIKTKAQSEKMDDDIKASKKTGDDTEETKAKRPKYDEDGNFIGWELVDTSAEGDNVARDASRETNIKNAEGAFTAKTKALVSSMRTGTDIACAVMKTYSAINAMIAAIHVANIMNYLTGFLEAVQRTQIGDAGKNELSYYMTGLSTKGTTYKVDGKTPIREGTSSLESPAWNQFFSDGTVVLANNDEVAEKFNREYAMSQSLNQGDGLVAELVSKVEGATSSISNSIEAYKTCLTSQMLMAGTELTADVILAFIPGGSIAKQAVKTFWENFIEKIWKEAVLGIAVGIIVTGLMSTVIPHLANALAINLIEDMTGEDAAYAINSGFNIYSGGQFQLSSGLPATKEKLMAQYRAQQEVIASEAEFARSEHSPFDVTNKYTFLGSIVNSMIPIASAYSSPLSTVSKTMSTVGGAFSSLLPTAKADGEVKFETSLNEECPNLSQIGVVGDAFCNPYIATDMNTMSTDPATTFDNVALDPPALPGEEENFNWDTVEENDGNPEINQNSQLGKWVIACAARESQFGTVDSNVMSAISLVNTGNSVLDAAIEGGVGSLPFVGTSKDIMDAANEEANLDWASGANCVNEKYAYYSRYSEDQRLMEAAGIIEESQVAKFLDKYYEENPIDDSYEGIIARYSGLSKDTVGETLALIEYADFIANYDPTTYGPEKYQPTEENIQFESSEVIASKEYIMNRYIIYDDLRTKIKVA